MGDTVDRLLKRLDEQATAETYGNDDGTYRVMVFSTEELRSLRLTKKILSRRRPYINLTEESVVMGGDEIS